MLRKALRLPRAAIAEVVHKGKSTHTSLFTLKTLPSLEKGPLFAFVASKKVFKQAVMRNKAKRRIKAVISGFKDRLVPFSGVFLLKKDIITCDFNDIIKTANESLRDYLKK